MKPERGSGRGNVRWKRGPWNYSVLTVEVEAMTFGADRGLASGYLWEVQP